MFIRVLGLISLIIKISAEQVAPSQTVVLVEYSSLDGNHLSSEDVLNKNADNYIKILSHLAKINVKPNVVVFPEATLEGKENRSVESLGIEIDRSRIPCSNTTSDPDFLKKLSCAARLYHTVLVLNLIQKSDQKFFTVDLVIGVSGRINFKIKKEDRIGSFGLRHGPIPFEIPIKYAFRIRERTPPFPAFVFTPTSLIIGFKFSYKKIFDLSDGYRFYVICSNWISQLPFLTSLQVYQMWAQEFKVTLFFAGANNPKIGQGGTGIYHGNSGPIFMDIATKGETKYYTYTFSDDEIPGNLPDAVEKDIDTLSKEMDGFSLNPDPDLKKYDSVKLTDLPSEFHGVKLCYDKDDFYFCCEFSITWTRNNKTTNKKHYFYHLVVYKGCKNYYSIFDKGGVELCAVIACLDDKLSSCGQRFKKYEDVEWPITFEKLEVRAEFAPPETEKVYFSMQFPNSLLSSIRPIHPNYTNWKTRIVFNEMLNTSRIERSFSITEPQKKILTFGIFGRNFSLIDDSCSKSEFASSPAVILLHLCVALILTKYNLIVT